MKKFKHKFRQAVSAALLSLFSLPLFASGIGTNDAYSELSTQLSSFNSWLLTLIKGPISLTITLVSFLFLIIANAFRFNLPSVVNFIALLIFITMGLTTAISMVSGG